MPKRFKSWLVESIMYLTAPPRHASLKLHIYKSNCLCLCSSFRKKLDVDMYMYSLDMF